MRKCCAERVLPSFESAVTWEDAAVVSATLSRDSVCSARALVRPVVVAPQGILGCRRPAANVHRQRATKREYWGLCSNLLRRLRLGAIGCGPPLRQRRATKPHEQHFGAWRCVSGIWACRVIVGHRTRAIIPWGCDVLAAYIAHETSLCVILCPGWSRESEQRETRRCRGPFPAREDGLRQVVASFGSGAAAQSDVDTCEMR